MISYFVKYEGCQSNIQSFLEYYKTKHTDILKQLDEIQHLTLHTPVEWTDPCSVQKGGLSLMAQMSFKTVEALNRSLASEARLKARTDFENFPKFEGHVFHQALSAEKIF